MTKTFPLSKFNPDFAHNHLRKKRALAVLEWCDEMRLSKKERTVHNSELQKVFGNTNRPGFAQWLYANLLVQCGQYAVGLRSRSYLLKQDGYTKIYNMLNVQPPTEVELVSAKYAELITGEISPEYNDYGDRRWHPIQNVKRGTRKSVFAGWWDYDIESSAPTLCLHYAIQHYRWVHKDESVTDPFPAISRLINDKAEIRNHLVKLLGVDLQQAKGILAAIFFRANLAPSFSATVFRTLSSDEERFFRLLNDSFIVQLRADVKKMWMYARLHDRYERAISLLAGHKPSKISNKAAKHRMAIYLSLERKVIDAMLVVLNQKGLPVILMHDGFMSKKKININELMSEVFSKTGIAMRLSEVALGSVQDIEIEDEPDINEMAEDGFDEDDDELDGKEEESGNSGEEEAEG